MTESFDTSPMPDPNPPVMPDPDIGAPTDPFNPNAPHTTPLPEPGLPGEEGSLAPELTEPELTEPEPIDNILTEKIEDTATDEAVDEEGALDTEIEDTATDEAVDEEGALDTETARVAEARGLIEIAQTKAKAKAKQSKRSAKGSST